MNNTLTIRKVKRNDDGRIEHRGPGRGKTNLPISAREQAKAHSAQSRINVPLNVQNWKGLAQDHQESLTWFHQHLLNEGISWNRVSQLLPKNSRGGGFYDRTVIYKVLQGSYEGSWDNIGQAILDYRNLWNERRKMKASTFARNPISEIIWSALDYALTANGITEIVGESGQGKTIAVTEWQEHNNHGKTVFVECPVFGGIKGLLRRICTSIGANKNQSIPQMVDSIERAFNRNRVLIIDEAARLLPSSATTPPKTLDYLREIHDRTGCALALITTARFDDTLRSNQWMFEQVLGRIDMPVRLPKILDDRVWLPLVEQYIKAPSRPLKELCNEIANRPLGGRMRRLDKVLKFASRIAATDKEALLETHVFRAVKILQKMMGEQQFATKSRN